MLVNGYLSNQQGFKNNIKRLFSLSSECLASNMKPEANF